MKLSIPRVKEDDEGVGRRGNGNQILVKAARHYRSFEDC